MGVRASYCLVCGLPIQHDHYVATEGQDVWAIYRSDNKPDGHFPFTDAHSWLLRGVAVKEGEGPHYGSCEDGALQADGEEYYVGDGYEDYLAMHDYCWKAAGEPRDYNEIYRCKYSYEATFLKKYQAQLFEFSQCVADGAGWILDDPSCPEGELNQRRIQRAVATPQPALDETGALRPPENVEELLASDVWSFHYRQYAEDKHDFWRFRDNVEASIDTSGYPNLEWVIITPGDVSALEMERFERALFAEVQSSKLAVALAAVTIQGRYYFIFQAKDHAAFEKALVKHSPPGELELQFEVEPAWTGYFEEFHARFPMLRGY